MKHRIKQAVDKKRRPISIHMQHRIKEGIFLLAIAFSIFMLISFASYHPTDPGWSSTGFGNVVANWGGRLGSWCADIFLSLFGMVAYLFPCLMVLSSWLSIKEEESLFTKKKRDLLLKFLGWLFIIISNCALVDFYLHFKSNLPASMGGIVGDLLANSSALLLNKIGSTLFFFTTFLCGVTLVTGLSWLGVIDRLGEQVYRACIKLIMYFKSKQQKTVEKQEPQLQNKIKSKSEDKPEKNVLPPENKPLPQLSVIINSAPIQKKKPEKIEVESKIQLLPGELPPLSLLNETPSHADKPFSNISFEELSLLVEQRLLDFGVEVKVVAVHPGPVITRFELDLAPGIKVSKITGLAKDIARSLSTTSVRVVEVIPGKSVIGLEIPNENREIVTLKDMFGSERYSQSRSPLSLVLGKDISGNPVVVDLAKMPHLLVAGTTGSGKSVSINAMLLSMLFKADPTHLRFILIDPKMLELSVYDGIPHLLTPVITDMKDAANALRWCVAEMDKRYRLMAALGVRNIAGYNQKVSDAIKQGQALHLPGTLVTDALSAKTILEPLPMIVVIADELADMMMVVGKKVEDLIARIAQKARAAGIHLILATQRPSVDVITGLIKANIPTRIAFQVSSRIDSRTILDQQGAEQLLGHGDMLYLPPGAGVPIRVHGAYVTDDEVHRVVAAWRTYGQPTYVNEVTEEISATAGEGDENGEQDPLYDEAVKIVTESRRASISLVQRKLRIGYNRAARMMEDMEAAGIVSSMDQSGTREVLVGETIG